ncbi:MAG: hypothetical protein BJ554DRAFT_5419 [Olpidium bornovanus]|uniref:Glycosyltransferase family 28 N-terminal domain-containing protein n=1 Tax=Olpidium bornovanus TaxID=278681 RepID=A0A8H8DL37_9FUNG|nr:MAG: hypothetical protein BJ554DRAFT_5419 [Olpidium bornovanus]
MVSPGAAGAAPNPLLGIGTGAAVPPSEQQNRAPQRAYYQQDMTPEQEQALCERYSGPSPMMQALVKSAKKSNPYNEYLRSRHLREDFRRKLGTVFIAVEPIVRNDWLGKYMSWMEEIVFDHLRSARLYVIILWGDGAASRYHSFVSNGRVAAVSARLGRPPANDIPVTQSTNTPPLSPTPATPADFPDSPHAFCETFVAENPTTSIVNVGQTCLTRKEAESFLVAWAYGEKRGSEKNRRAFVDRFLNFVVTHDRVWELKAVQPTGADQTAPYYFDPIMDFKTPLAWYLWRYKRTKECRKSLARRNATRHGGLKLSVDRRTKTKNPHPKQTNSGESDFTSLDHLSSPANRGDPSDPALRQNSAEESDGDADAVRVGVECEDSAGASAESSDGGSPRISEDRPFASHFVFGDKKDDSGASPAARPPLPPRLLPAEDAPLPAASPRRRSSEEKANKIRKKKSGKGKHGPPAIFVDTDGICERFGRFSPVVEACVTSLFRWKPIQAPAMRMLARAWPTGKPACLGRFAPQIPTTPTLDPLAITPRPPVITVPNGTVVPKLNILITTVGSRGDVQPFLAVGIQLKEMGHHNGLCTDPGLIPTIDSVKSGDIRKKRDIIAAIVESCWKACTEADPGPPPSTNEDGSQPYPKLPPFVAECIISNPPSFGHVHVAERLSIPLHIIFCEMLTWQGLGDVINKWRREHLGLPGVPVKVGTALMSNLKVPHTYMWSPNLIAKPDDWPDYINVTGFCFLSSLSTNYKPDDKLKAFLEAGEKPVYIGFGSIVVDDPSNLTKIVFEAVRRTGLRAIVSKGWGGFGGKEEDAPENICLIGNVPHDWLFQCVTAVCHHGGAGTTAAGLRLGRPTIVVPFFGCVQISISGYRAACLRIQRKLTNQKTFRASDQPFWGSMIAGAGAGPEPIPHKKLSVENLCEALLFATSEQAIVAAGRLGEKMREENGAFAAARSFHRHLPTYHMRCDVDPTRLAAFYNPQSDMKLSSVAAQVLISEGRIRRSRLYRYIPKRWVLERAQADVFTAILDGLRSLFVNLVRGFTSLINETAKSVRSASEKHFGAAVLEVCKGVVRGLAHFIYYPFKGIGTFVGYMIEGLKNSNTIFDTDELPSESPMVFGFVDGCFKGMESLLANLVYLPLKGLVIYADKVLSGHRLVIIEREAAPKISVSQWNEMLSNYDTFLQHRVTRVRQPATPTEGGSGRGGTGASWRKKFKKSVKANGGDVGEEMPAMAVCPLFWLIALSTASAFAPRTPGSRRCE